METAAGVLVREARTDSAMTQRALAEAVGLRQSNIAAIEAGTRLVSDIDLLVDIDACRSDLNIGAFQSHTKELVGFSDTLACCLIVRESTQRDALVRCALAPAPASD